jgi:hypothetical protein
LSFEISSRCSGVMFHRALVQGFHRPLLAAT